MSGCNLENPDFSFIAQQWPNEKLGELASGLEFGSNHCGAPSEYYRDLMQRSTSSADKEKIASSLLRSSAKAPLANQYEIFLQTTSAKTWENHFDWLKKAIGANDKNLAVVVADKLNAVPQSTVEPSWQIVINLRKALSVALVDNSFPKAFNGLVEQYVVRADKATEQARLGSCQELAKVAEVVLTIEMQSVLAACRTFIEQHVDYGKSKFFADARAAVHALFRASSVRGIGGIKLFRSVIADDILVASTGDTCVERLEELGLAAEAARLRSMLTPEQSKGLDYQKLKRIFQTTPGDLPVHFGTLDKNTKFSFFREELAVEYSKLNASQKQTFEALSEMYPDTLISVQTDFTSGHLIPKTDALRLTQKTTLPELRNQIAVELAEEKFGQRNAKELAALMLAEKLTEGFASTGLFGELFLLTADQ